MIVSTYTPINSVMFTEALLVITQNRKQSKWVLYSYL